MNYTLLQYLRIRADLKRIGLCQAPDVFFLPVRNIVQTHRQFHQYRLDIQIQHLRCRLLHHVLCLPPVALFLQSLTDLCQRMVIFLPHSTDFITSIHRVCHHIPSFLQNSLFCLIVLQFSSIDKFLFKDILCDFCKKKKPYITVSLYSYNTEKRLRTLYCSRT